MLVNILVLVISTLAGGYSFHLFPGLKKDLRLPLIFAGSYLFAITIIHIIPELFVISPNPSKVGLFILFGFFLQQFLEYFSSGIEHGHFHSGSTISLAGRFSIVVALIIHSLLEGTLLIHDSPFHEQHESYSLLLGIVFHKMPAAFALMVTINQLGRKAFYILLLFSLASPVGLLLGYYLILSADVLLVLFAVVCGSFLHISTTIFVETSPDHHFGVNKILISLLGATIAIAVEYLI